MPSTRGRRPSKLIPSRQRFVVLGPSWVAEEKKEEEKKEEEEEEKKEEIPTPHRAPTPKRERTESLRLPERHIVRRQRPRQGTLARDELGFVIRNLRRPHTRLDGELADELRRISEQRFRPQRRLHELNIQPSDMRHALRYIQNPEYAGLDRAELTIAELATLATLYYRVHYAWAPEGERPVQQGDIRRIYGRIVHAQATATGEETLAAVRQAREAAAARGAAARARAADRRARNAEEAAREPGEPGEPEAPEAPPAREPEAPEVPPAEAAAATAEAPERELRMVLWQPQNQPRARGLVAAVDQAIEDLLGRYHLDERLRRRLIVQTVNLIRGYHLWAGRINRPDLLAILPPPAPDQPAPHQPMEGIEVAENYYEFVARTQPERMAHLEQRYARLQQRMNEGDPMDEEPSEASTMSTETSHMRDISHLSTASSMSGVDQDSDAALAAMFDEDTEERAREAFTRMAYELRRAKKKQMDDITKLLTDLNVDNMADFRSRLARLTRILPYQYPEDFIRIQQQLREWLIRTSNELDDAVNEGRTKDSVVLNEKYGVLRTELEALDEMARQNFPNIFEERPETDLEFLKRYEKAEKAFDKALNEQDVPTMDAIRAQLVEMEPRMGELRNQLMEADVQTYRNMVEGEYTGMLARKEEDAFYKQKQKDYDKARKRLIDLSDKIEAERDTDNPQYSKILDLLNQWEDQRATLDAERPYYQATQQDLMERRNREREAFQMQMFYDIPAQLEEMAQRLFAPYEVGRLYYAMPELDMVAKLLFDARKKYYEYADRGFENLGLIEKEDEDNLQFIYNTINRLNEYFTETTRWLDETGGFTRNPMQIYQDLERKKEWIHKLIIQSAGRTMRIRDAEKKLLVAVDTSEKEMQSEHATRALYEMLTQDFPADWNEARQALQEEIMDLRRRVRTDISSFGPFLTVTVDQIWNRFVSRIQNVSDTERERFKFAIDAEKEYLYKTISKEANIRLGLEIQNRNAEVQQFLFDPTTFSNRHQMDSEMVGNTVLGRYLSETRRLMDLLRRSMELRARMVIEPYDLMGTEGAFDAAKFDLVLTHLYPRSLLDLKLRYLMTLPNKAQYKNSPFVLALKEIEKDFDISSLTYENLIERTSTLAEAAETFLRQKVGMTKISWGDFEIMANELTRLISVILTQVAPPEDDTAVDRPDSGLTVGQPPSEQIKDIDAGAIMNAEGYRINPTFNPTTHGQITRDKIDDAKYQSYMRAIGPITSVFIGDPKKEEDTLYVPMHPEPAKFYFATENYASLGNQYQSMRPLIPKKTVKDPNGIIETTLEQYGPMLGIKKRKSKPSDHPVFVQQEAIELTEFVQAYKNYTTRSAGDFIHEEHLEDKAGGGGAGAKAGAPNPAGLDLDNPEEGTGGKKRKTDPNDTGERISDPLMRGLRSAWANGMAQSVQPPFQFGFR